MKEKNLTGKRIFLRAPTDKDFAEFARAAKASRKFHKGLVNPPLTKKDFAEFVARNEKAENEFFLICRVHDNAICGAVNLSQIFRRGFQNAYLGYYLFENFTGEGFMTEAVGLILKFAFKTLKLHRIEANVQPENVASIKVLERSGFTKEGFSRKYLKVDGDWRDHERWAIIIEDWKLHGKQGSKITS
jgi:ribosomal-protein-alanine N-acetyltransferase